MCLPTSLTAEDSITLRGKSSSDRHIGAAVNTFGQLLRQRLRRIDLEIHPPSSLLW
jgi:hypothetical protein